MGREGRIVASASLLAAAALLTPSAAEAYCRTTTSHVPAGYDPSAVLENGELQGCYDVGLPLYWANACVSYDLQQNASNQVPYAIASELIATAFSKWTGTICDDGGGGNGRVSIDVRDFGPVACNLVQYNQYGPNQHVILFEDTWSDADSSNTLALTTVTFDLDTGEIYDADMQINNTVPLSTADTVPPGGYDFESIVTHETGHFFGMAHSQDDHATMYAHYTPGDEVMRNLTGDDVAGICDIYAPNGLRHVAKQASPSQALEEAACNATPRHGFTSACMSSAASSSSPSSGCAVGGAGIGRDGRSLSFVGLGAFALAGALRRRRESTASAPRRSIVPQQA